MAEPLSLCAQEARRHDRDRFLCALFAPAERREDLFTLLAFNAEIARTAEVVSEPLLGQIRLQWWRDAIAGAFGDTAHDVPVGNHVLDPLAALIRGGGLRKELFDELLNARLADLDEKGPADAAEFAAYADGSAGALGELMLEALVPGGDKALAARARTAGLIWGMTGVLRAVAFHAARNRVLLPSRELLRAGLTADDVMARRSPEALSGLVRDLAGDIRQRLSAFRAEGAPAPRAARPVLLQARLAELHLNRLERFGFDPFAPRLEGGRAGRQLRLSLSALFEAY